MNIKIIGDGAWGRALYYVLQQNIPKVRIVKKGEIIKNADIIVISVPTQSIRKVLDLINLSGKFRIIINTAKGVEKETHKLPFQIVHEKLKNKLNYYSLIGPSFAAEVNKNMPTLVNLGYEKEGSYNQIVKNLFQTDFFRVRLTRGVGALELSGAFKNIYAIGCGFASGLGYGINTRVKLIVLAMEELSKLFKNLNLETDSNSIAGTIGDLILTCNSVESRNFRFGKLLSQNGKSESLEKIIGTVEGYYSLDSIKYFEQKSHTKLHLANFIASIVDLKDHKKKSQNFANFVKKS